MSLIASLQGPVFLSYRAEGTAIIASAPSVEYLVTVYEEFNVAILHSEYDIM